MKQKLKIDVSKNNLVFGDCKDWLPYIPSNSIDLIYIDPPFFSNKNYEVIWGNGHEKRSFTDRWKGGIEHYIGWMRGKLIEAHRVLKKTGSILLHCDWHVNHRLRCLLDEIFDKKNFVNEIIWRYKRWPINKKGFQKMHDTILLYSKTESFKFNIFFEERSESTKKRWGDKKIKANHNRKGERIPSTSEYQTSKGVPLSDVLNISIIAPVSKERIGYRTQKPEALLNILIKVLSDKQDTVLDFFAGGGTTAKVCCDLNRGFITGDISPVAYRVIQDRLIQNGYEDFEKPNPPLTREEWLTINDKEFEKKICMFMGWVHNSSSKPVDGWVDKNKTIPVEIKNHTGTTGVGDIRKLAGVMSELGLKKGIFVSWSFSTGCYEYVSKLERTEKKKIELIPAHTIIGNLVLKKSQREKYQRLYEERVKEAKQKAQILKTG